MIKNVNRSVWAIAAMFTLLVVMMAQSAFCQQKVLADDNVYLEVTGYQISTTLEAYRTLYSISDPSGKAQEVGLVYGLTNSVTEGDMVVGSTNSTVYSYAATSVGKLDENYSGYDDGTTYVRTMEFIKTAEFYNANLSIRAYAKLADGSYVYSNISTVSVYRIADTLYKGSLMNNISGHNYLYNNVLSVVDSSYSAVEYKGSQIIVPSETTQQQTTAAEVTTVASTNHTVNSSLTKPAGLTYAGNTDLPYYFAWGGVETADSYDVYVNGNCVANVTAASVNLDASVFTNGSGTYTIGVGAVYGNQVSEAITVEYVYSTSGEVVTTATVQQTTTTAEVTTTVSSNHTVNASLAKPTGLTYAGNSDLPYYFAWGAAEGAESYDVYVNGSYVVNVTAASVNLDASVFTNGSGTYTIGVGAVYGNQVSEAVTVEYVYSTSGEVVTTTAAQQTTTAPQETTTSITFTTDSSIAQPFGLVLSSPENGYVTIVWGAGDINCYNVYVDGERRRTGIKAQSLTIPVYFEGTHTIEIATVVGTTESIRVSQSIAIVGVGEKETEPETCPPELQPELRSNLSFRDDRVLMQLNNETNGKYSDSQVYWCLVGYNANNQLCYLDKYGNLIPVTLSMNNITINDRQVADVSYTLAEASYVYVPSIKSGRMYFSYEKPIYLTFNQGADGTIGFAGPDLNNPLDPNADTLYEFAEFTIDGKYYWGNTTRVDFFSFPVVTRLIGHTQYEKYDKTVGDIGTRDEIFAAFQSEVPDAFKTLVTDKRIMAPCKTTFNAGGTYANYFDAYINEFWTKYTNEDLVFNCEGGTFTGRVSGDKMYFTKSGDGTVYTISKPTTQDVLEGKGAFASGNATELVIEAQLCAAFNRGVATEPSKWNKPKYYYQSGTYNAYSGFFHNHSITGLAYGFCYDDVNDQSTLLWYDDADALVIDLKW